MLTATNAPRSRPVASPVRTPQAAVTRTASRSEGSSGTSPFARAIASAKAPIPKNAPCPSDGIPASPTAYAEPDRGEREVDEAGEIDQPALREHGGSEQGRDEQERPERRRPAPARRGAPAPPRRARFSSGRAPPAPRSCATRNRLGTKRPVGDQAEGEGEREELTVLRAEPEVADPQVVDRRLGETDSEPRGERRPR